MSFDTTLGRTDLSPLLRRLSSVWADRAIAVIAILPFAYSLRHEMKTFGLNLPWIVANANFLLLVAAMLVRRPPIRVTPRPTYWLLAFVATYWLFITGKVATAGIAVVPTWFTFALSFTSFAISVYARLSLGRSIGLVPAERALVTTGAYRFVRHPIYTGIYFAYLALALQNCSAVNVAIFATGAGLFMIKSVVEERFLAQAPEYAAYMTRVPWRWLPFVA